jgi:hypothetical protein
MRSIFLHACTLAVLFAGEAPRQLTVTDGYGSAAVPPGTSLQVWAETPEPGQVFDGWAGATSNLEQADEWRSRLVMPSSDIAIRATYRDAPIWEPQSRQLALGSDGSAIQLTWHAPSSPVALLLLFHGTGGTGANWFTKTEGRAFLDRAVARRMAVAAFDCHDRVVRQWSTDLTSANPDAQNTTAALEWLRGSGTIQAATPVFALGMSQGGAFSSLAAHAFGFSGNAVYCSRGLAPLIAVTSVPQIWCLAEQDLTPPRDAWEGQVAADQATLTLRGIRNMQVRQPPSPVHEQRFARIAGISLADSAAIVASLRDAGWIGEDGMLTADPSVDASWQSAIPGRFSAYGLAIADQLNCCWAGHEFFSDATARTIGFLLDSLPNPVISTATAPARQGVSGQLFSMQVSATGLTAPTWSIASGPAGMAIDPTSGLLTWTPSAPGAYAFTIQASTGSGPDDAQTFTVVVEGSTAGGGDPPPPPTAGDGGGGCASGAAGLLIMALFGMLIGCNRVQRLTAFHSE